MNCRDTETLLLAARDGVLSPGQHAASEEHVATCPACRRFRTQLTEVLEQLRQDTARVPLPPIDEEWHLLRARLDTAETTAKKNPRAPLVWFAAPLAAAAALAFTFYGNRPAAPGPGDSVQVADAASAEFVEAGDAEAATMVYVDKESGWLVVWAADDASERSG